MLLMDHTELGSLLLAVASLRMLWWHVCDAQGKGSLLLYVPHVSPDVAAQKPTHPLPEGRLISIWRRATALLSRVKSTTFHKASKKGDGLLSAPKNK